MERNPMSSTQLQIPLFIKYNAEIKKRKDVIEDCNNQMTDIMEKNVSEMQKTQSHIDKLSRNLRNLKLNVEYRREIIRALKSEDRDTNLFNNADMEQKIDEMTSKSKAEYIKFEDFCYKIKQQELNKMNYTEELQKMPETILIIGQEIDRINHVQVAQEREIFENKKILGIADETDDDDMLDGSQDSTHMDIQDKRMKILKKKKEEVLSRIDKKEQDILKQKEAINTLIAFHDTQTAKKKQVQQADRDAHEQQVRFIQDQIKKHQQTITKKKLDIENANKGKDDQENLDLNDPAVNNLAVQKDQNQSQNINVSESNTRNDFDYSRKKGKQKNRVTKADICFVAKAMSWHCRYNRLTYQDIFNKLKKFIDESSDVSVINMINFFSTETFDFKVQDPDHDPKKGTPVLNPFIGSKSVELLARYIIEDNYDEKLNYNENSTSPTIIVRSILKKLIGVYKVYFDDDIERLNLEGI